MQHTSNTCCCHFPQPDFWTCPALWMPLGIQPVISAQPLCCYGYYYHLPLLIHVSCHDASLLLHLAILLLLNDVALRCILSNTVVLCQTKNSDLHALVQWPFITCTWMNRETNCIIGIIISCLIFYKHQFTHPPMWCISQGCVMYLVNSIKGLEYI